MSVSISLFAGAGWQFFDSNGIPLAGGLLYTYAAGTTTPQATYTTSAGSIANANPIVLDSAGRTANEIWLTNGSTYKFILNTSTGTQIGSYDNIAGVNDFSSFSASSGSSLIGYIQSGAGAVAETVQTKLRESISVKDFGAVGNGSTNDAAAIQAAITFAASTGAEVFIPRGTYFIGSTTIQMVSQVSLFGEGLQVSVIKGSNYLLDYGTAGPVQNAHISNLQLWCTDNTKACVYFNGLTGQSSGDFCARFVFFKCDNSVAQHTTNFTYSGNWFIENCYFQKYFWLLYGLVNTIRMRNCVFNTTGAAAANYLISFGNSVNVNQVVLDGITLEVANGGGINIYSGNTFTLTNIWFYDETTNFTAIYIRSSVSFVTINNAYSRGSYTATLKVEGNGPVQVTNTNMLGDATSLTTTAAALPRFNSVFGTATGAVLWGFNHDGNGKIWLSSNTLAGLQAIDVFIPATAAGAGALVPVPRHFSETLFKRIIAVIWKNGSIDLANPGGTYTVGLQLVNQSTSTTVSSWTNANVGVAKYTEITVGTSGSYTNADYTNYISNTNWDTLYLQLYKNGGGAATDSSYATLLVM